MLFRSQFNKLLEKSFNVLLILFDFWFKVSAIDFVFLLLSDCVCSVCCIGTPVFRLPNELLVLITPNKKIAPTTAAEVGISEDEIIDALVMANKLRPERYTILGDNGISREAAYELAYKTEVI